MLSSATSQTSSIFPPPGGISPSSSATTAAAALAAAPDEDAIFGVGADEAFFSSIGALVSSPPPSSSPPSVHGTTSPDLRWPSSYGALVASAASSSTLATATDILSAATTGSAFACSREAVDDSISPLLAPEPPATPSQSLGPPAPPLLLPGSRITGGSEGTMAPAQVPAAGMLPPPPSLPLPPSAPAAPSAKKTTSGLTKSRAKGGGIRQKRSKSGGVSSSSSSSSNRAVVSRREAAGLEDGEQPDKKVPLLIVGSKCKTRQLSRAADVGSGSGTGSGNIDGGSVGGAAAVASSLDDTVKMLTVEMGRNGREVETDYADTGQRAVQQVKALAGCDMRYGMVVLEVEESLAAATEVARELRDANRYTPIVAVAPPSLPPAPRPLDAWKYFNEILAFPISAAQVRHLATRWLLQPPSFAGAAATSGMVGETVDLDPMSSSAEALHAGGSSTSISAGSTINSTTATLVSSSLPAGGGVPLSDPSCGSSSVSGGEGGALLASSRASAEVLPKPRASMPSPSPSASTPIEGEGRPPPTEPQVTGRVFGGGVEDRASPCRLFCQAFEKMNADMEVREYDFMFRHGTIVLRVQESELGETKAEVFSACEYATAHFGNIAGKPLESMFEFPATNEKTANKILEHIKRSDTDSMCSYINLKSEVRWMTSSFVSVRSLSKRPERGPAGERLPPWYVILKICLPSTLGLIKEPELLEEMYSKKAEDEYKRKKREKLSKRGPKHPSKRNAKKAKVTPADGDINEDGTNVGGAPN
eukprot:g19341.t1